MKVMSTVATHCAMGKDPLPLFEIACLFVCLDHVARFIEFLALTDWMGFS
jgi:hypothetical protein